MGRNPQTTAGIPILYQEGPKIFCPDCAPQTAVGNAWVYGEEHECCSSCNSALWPARMLSTYGILARDTAPLWDRYASRVGQTSYRLLATAARVGAPVGGPQIRAVATNLEGALLASVEPQETRWLRALWYEARRAIRWLPRPVLLDTKASPGLDTEPVVILARPPKGGTMRVSIHTMTAQDLGLMPP